MSRFDRNFKNGVWQNTIKKHSIRTDHYFKPTNHDEIAEIILRAERENKTVRAVGSGHSFSNVAIIREHNFLILPEKLNKVRKVAQLTLKEKYQEAPFVWVQSGTTIKSLNNELTNLGYSITNMGGIDHQTISGAISTGTHGTGINVPAIHGMVRAIQIVTHGGQKLQVERTKGISKKSLIYNGDFKIIRDDDTFHAMMVSLGAFGIIYAYILRVEHEYWLKEKNYILPWAEVKPILASRELLNKFRGVKIIINPYILPKGKFPKDHTCLISTYEIEYSKPLVKKFGDQFRNLVGTILGNLRIVGAIGYTSIKKWSLKHPDRMPRLIETALKNLQDKGYRNTAHKVLFQGGEYIKERAYDCEVAFDYKDDNYITVIDELIKNAAILKENNLYHNSPIGIRYVKRSKASIAPEFGREVVYVDTPMVLDSNGEVEIIESCLKLMLEHGGIPHWGKFNKLLIGDDFDTDQIHPGLKKWRSLMRIYNPKGTFTSLFMEEMKIT
ncbi:FAD-binding protein [Echinicola sp. 20G]|uniref:FAD-binding protein n=1 Tax=Echinicola sp. 20G TaxID=2781961 RepID=UPI0019102A34|nr:FAD-binding protein [Echinicola sp. 20G]